MITKGGFMKRTVAVICLLVIMLLTSTITYAEQKPEIFVQTGHKNAIEFLAIDPTNRYLASVSQEELTGEHLKMWDLVTGRELYTYRIEFGRVNNIYFEDQKLILICRAWVGGTKDKINVKIKSLNLSGKIIEDLDIPIKSYDLEYISKNRNYGYYLRLSPFSKIYNLKDGSDIVFPKEDGIYKTIIDLGDNFFGIVKHYYSSEYYNTLITVYDKETLKVINNLKIPEKSQESHWWKGIFDNKNKLFYLLTQDQSHWHLYVYTFDDTTSNKLSEIKFKEEFDDVTIRLLGGRRLLVEFNTLRKHTSSFDRKIRIIAFNNNIIESSDPLFLNESASYAVMNNGEYIINGDKNGGITFYDVKTGSPVKKIGIRPIVFKENYITNNKLLNIDQFFDLSNNNGGISYNLWDLNSASLEKFNITATTRLVKRAKRFLKDALCYLNPEEIYSKIPSYFFRENYKLDEDYDKAVTSLPALLKDIPTNLHADHHGPYVTLYYSENIRFTEKGLTFDRKDLAKFYAFSDGEWIVITPDGYYNASPNGDKYLNVRIGNNVYGIENYREAFYRPDIVRLALSGGSIKDLKTIAEVKQPPLVEIVNTPSNTDKDEVKVTLKLIDQGGGIGDIRLYLNGSAVILDNTRGISLNPKEGEKEVFKEYTIKLTNGENSISAVAFNRDNSMQSNPATFKITADLKIFKKPSLYAVVVGINEYKNPKLTLKYAVADANLFADTLNEVAGRMFDNVVIKRLVSPSDTTKEAIKKVMGEMKQLNPDDLFVFYVAAHGTVDEGEYFLLTSNVGSVSTYKLREDALTQGELKEFVANVPSTKKMIIIDTCNAGKLGEALQSALLTRGMSEDVAIKILSRAVGSTVISASTSLQEAIEGYNNHGLFTYILSEGLKGKADTDGDGFIKTIELANYVDSEVPSIAERVFKHPQYPTVTPIGTSFPIGRVR